MHLKSIFLSALAATSVSAHARRKFDGEEKPFGCTAPRPSEHQLAVIASLAEQELAESNSTMHPHARQTSSIAVDVYFHVVAASTALTDGYVTVSGTL